MTESAANPARSYITTITNVREVGLTCSADLAFWQARMKKEGLYACNIGGKAELLFVAIESKFMGITFRELSISLMVSRHDNATEPEASFLLHAYNSLRPFAWSERVFFKTPYYPAQIRVNEQFPASIWIQDSGQVVMNAAMSSTPKDAQHDKQVWDAPIYLPDLRGGKSTNMFYARLSGDRDLYPFQPADTLQFHVPPNDRVFQHLLDSGIAGKGWHIRKSAVHAKSKTVNRAF